MACSPFCVLRTAIITEAPAPANSRAAHPGFARTNLTNAGATLDGGKKLFGHFTDLTYKLYSQDAVRGAQPILFAATASSVRGGDYYGPDGLFELKGGPKKLKKRLGIRSLATAKKLWNTGLELTGLEMPTIN